MPKMSVALVTSVPEKGWGWGKKPYTFQSFFNFYFKETDSVLSVKGLHLWK